MQNMNKFISKEQILEEFTELGLTEYGDFIVQPEIIKNYEIIDFHTHITEGIANAMIPILFRKEVIDYKFSFFDHSPYCGKGSYLDFKKPCYQCWPKTLFSSFGLLVLLDMAGLTGFISSMRRASAERLVRDMKDANIDKAVVLAINGNNRNDTTKMVSRVLRHQELIPFGSIHPYDSKSDKKIEEYTNLGIKGFKVNPHIWKINF